MHKLFKIIPLCSLMSVALLMGCSQEKPQSKTTTATSYNIGSDMTFPPFESIENEQPVGFDIDIAKQIFAHSGDEVNFIDSRFSNLITGLEAKKFDLVMSALYITKDRLEKVDMVPYYMTTEALVTLSNSPYQPKTRDDLCGKTISSQKGSMFPEQLRQMSRESCVLQGKSAITVREFDTSPEAVQALLAQAVDAHYDDSSVAKSTVDKLQGRVVISSTEDFFPVLGGIAVPKGNPDLLAKVQQGLVAIKDSGEYEKLIAKYNLQAPSEAEIAKYMPQ